MNNIQVYNYNRNYNLFTYDGTKFSLNSVNGLMIIDLLSSNHSQITLIKLILENDIKTIHELNKYILTNTK